MATVRIENLEKNHGEEKIFSGMNLSVESGEIVAIKGETGIGKTTLKRCIAGLEDYHGKIDVDGEISYLFQDSRMMPWLNVRKNVMMPFRLQGLDVTPEREERAERLAEEFNVRRHFDKKINEISGGQKQRLLQVRALVTDPDILLLDEPFSSLDKETRTRIYDAVLDHCREKEQTVLLTSHQEDIYDRADRVIDFHSRGGVNHGR